MKKKRLIYGKQIMLDEERKLGIEEGIKENQILIAKNMKKENMDINIISKITGLGIEEIKNL